MKRIIQIGKPVHLTVKKGVTVCGLAGSTHLAAYDPRDVECLRCRRTSAYRARTEPESRQERGK